MQLSNHHLQTWKLLRDFYTESLMGFYLFNLIFFITELSLTDLLGFIFHKKDF